MFRTFLFCLNRNPGKCRLARTFVEIVGYDITARFDVQSLLWGKFERVQCLCDLRPFHQHARSLAAIRNLLFIPRVVRAVIGQI